MANKSKDLLDEARYCFCGYINTRTWDPLVAQEWLTDANVALEKAARINLVQAWIFTDELPMILAKIAAFKVIIRFPLQKPQVSTCRARMRILAAIGAHMHAGGTL